MADNRLYLTCAICGKRLFLGKAFHNGHGAFYVNYDGNGTLEQKLNNFYSAHILHDDGDNFLGTNFYIEHECFEDAENKKLRDFHLRLDY